MSSIVILVIVLLVIAAFCIVFIFIHNSRNKQRTNGLQLRMKKIAADNKLEIAVAEEINSSIFGLDANHNMLIVCGAKDDRIIQLAGLKSCRKQKKWLHIPAEKGARPETHLEKISLLLEFSNDTPAAELIFYEYRSHSIFQMHELEQKTDYWELLLNRKISIR